LVKNRTMDKNILSALLALETSSILSIIIFFSLIRPSFYYSKRVIFTCFFITLLWFVVSVYSIIKRKKEKKGIKNYIVSSVIYFVVIFYMIRTVWFSSYLTLAPEYAFFNGLSHPDTLYLSTLCEAIKNFGYPALLSEGLEYHKYHYLSIVFLAVISKIVKIPCLITYNFLYPAVFFPLFIYLFFQAVGVVREYMKKNNYISVTDVLFSLFVIIGYLPFRYLNLLFLGYSSAFLSESFCVSLILVLMYIVVIGLLKNKTNGKRTVNYLITLLFVFIITASKISVGIIFSIYLGWFFIREEGISLSSILLLAFGFIFLIFSLSLFNRNNQNINEQSFVLFHFIKTYLPKKNIISHLFFLVFPSFLLFLTAKGTAPYRSFYKTKESILAEASLVTVFFSVLPGALFKIEGGSAAYFFLPALFISLFLLLCFSRLQILFSKLIKEEKILIILLVLVLYGESLVYEPYYGSTLLKATPREMIERYKQGRRDNRQVINSGFYKALTKINKMTEGKKKQYCLFVSDNCDIFKRYKGKYYFMKDKGLLAMSSYLGMPVISDSEKAKEMHIENIIFLEKNTYRIVNLR